MIARVFRLMDTKRIEMKQREICADNNTVLVKPEYMSICAADQRYYFGKRKREILNQKLPMALIHEATGTVLRDFSGHLPQGTKVVMLPLENGAESPVKANYREDSKFASSGEDGFMRDLVAISRDRVVPINAESSLLYVFTEMLSVALGAISAYESACQTPVVSFGVWGDGSMGFIMGLALHCKYPAIPLYIFGKTARKLQKFSYAANVYYIDQVPKDISISHAFECVGGRKSEEAIIQIIDRITPQGVVSLLGVSENPINIDTRKLLDKGLRLIGNSRSDKDDFIKAVRLISDNENCRKYIRLLISDIIDVKTERNIAFAFEQDVLNDFKTVVKWSI